MENSFGTYANQRHVTISKDTPQKGNGKPFIYANCDAIERAAQELSGEVAFKLYIYLVSNNDKFTLWFSPAIFAQRYGVSIDRGRKAFKELIDKGYITECGSNQYIFHDVPQLADRIYIPEVTEKRWVPTKDGSKTLVTYTEFYSQVSGQAPDEVLMRVWEKCEKETESV